jgi:hypothetical protein
MGFGLAADRVRDGRLAHGRRVAALCSCVQLYRPIGHRATLSFLAELAGPYQRHEHALLRALDALEASRAVWLVEVGAYAERRAAEKRLGLRSPRLHDPFPASAGGHWYATKPDVSRRAALHALKLWERADEPVTTTSNALSVRSLVRECIATGGRLAPHQLAALTDSATVLAERKYRVDAREYYEAMGLRWAARLVASAVRG